MKQVPEGKKKVNTEKQIQILREKLAGNQAFATCRGQLGHRVTGIVGEIIGKNPSPTAVLGEWDDFFGKARVMTNLLAQFQRDGLDVAYKELYSALESDRHLLPGETVPIKQTRPITVLMLEPERTVALLRWLLEDHWMSLRDYLDWKDGRDRSEAPYGKVSKPNPLTKRLYEQFPTLEALARKHRDKYEGLELLEAFKEQVIGSFAGYDLSKGKTGQLSQHQWNDHVEYVPNIPFVYIFEMEQSEVLKIFSREDQKRVATWQFNLPKTIPHTYVGLHPRSLQTRFEKSHPALMSRGMSNGLGGMVLKDDPCSGHDKDHPYPISWYSQAKAGKYGMVFAFF
ncbi:MAG: hypothetical protein KGJ35_02430 [Patescibacteria group bacterium]|nr:hypothetical protein [Patescibacteria group bacterium]